MNVFFFFVTENVVSVTMDVCLCMFVPMYGQKYTDKQNKCTWSEK